MKTPGVYVVEKNAFPNSVVEVATAVPAFVGYTERALNGTKSLNNVPFRISSMGEFVQYFGEAPAAKFEFSKEDGPGQFITLGNRVLKDKAVENVSIVEKSVTDALKASTRKTATEKLLEEAEGDAKKAIQATLDVNEAAFKTAQEKAAANATALQTLVEDVNAVFDGMFKTTKMEAFVTAASDPEKYTDTTVTEALMAVRAEIDETDVSDQTEQYYAVKRTDAYNLYYNIRFFFANGGGSCYIVSVNQGYRDDLDKDVLIAGIDALLKEQEPTMLLIPEAVYLDNQQASYDVQNAMLRHCGYDMRNRFAILDVYDGFKDRKDPSGDSVLNFRMGMPTEFLDFGAAYYPWLNTSVMSENEVSFENITEGRDLLAGVLKAFSRGLNEEIDKMTDTALIPNDKRTIQKILFNQIPVYAEVMKEMLHNLNLMPPSSAMAGVYTTIDNTKEVWKAPANVSLSNVISTTVNISHNEQEDLNVPLDGKGINAIRFFTGEGIKVWGARTLDGNSLDWRYINVRRTMIMLEESIKNAAKAFVFEPNVANTWVSVRSMIGNFLNGIWKRGGLAGSSPDDAYSVHIGLGDTMTPEDILEGRMNITVLVAISRPAEFIEITFQQQMQKS